MLKSVFLLFALLLFGANLNAQQKTKLHIATLPRNHLPGFTNFHFSVNGNEYKLKAGQCLELVLQTDSIHIDVEDKRLVKKETDDITVAAAEDIYVWVRVTWTGNYRNPRYGAEVVCKTCFEELKKECKKTLIDN